MNKREENHYKMFSTTRDYLDENSNVWSSIPKIVEYKNNLDNLYLNITEISGKTNSVTGVSKLKGKLKTHLGIKVSILSGQLVAYANDIEDEDLEKAMHFTQSDVIKCNDASVNELVTPLLDTASGLLEKLVNYGTTELNITEVSTTLDDFNVLIGKPRSVMNKKFSSKKEVSGLIDDTNKLLTMKMDKVLLMYKESNPEFYEGYLRARVIVDN